MKDCNPAMMPYVSGLNLKRYTTSNLPDFPFLSCIGSLLYLVQGIRMDLCWIVSYLARFSSCYDNTHVHAVKHVLRYLKFTSDFKLKICSLDDVKLIAFVDSDFAGCENSRRSTFGYEFENELFYWESKLHDSVVLSSFEAEYIASSECIRDVISVFNFLKEIVIDLDIPVILCDNLAALKVGNHSNLLIIVSESRFISFHLRRVDELLFLCIP
jgi:hypothetical protein